nr:hypothetical protein CFP56_18930 [Quercus suber]
MIVLVASSYWCLLCNLFWVLCDLDCWCSKKVYDSLLGADALCGSGDCVIAECDECISCSFTAPSAAPFIMCCFSECL